VPGGTVFESLLGELKAVEELAGSAWFDAQVGKRIENGMERGVDGGRVFQRRQLEGLTGGGFSRRDVDAGARVKVAKG